MKRFVVPMLVTAVLGVTAWAAQEAKSLANRGDPAVLKAEQILQQAIRNMDGKTAEPLLDEQFTWTTEAGKTLTKTQFLRELKTPASGRETDYTDVKARGYGQLVAVTGSGVHHGTGNVTFLRVWVKRPAGWLLFAHQSTRIVAASPAARQSPAGTPSGGDAPVECDNPCRSVPFTPKAAVEQEVVSAYQAVETAVTLHDAEAWGKGIADEFVGISQRYTGQPATKASRIAGIKQPGSVRMPTVLSMQAFAFGDAAVLIADHQGINKASRPYHVIRVWVRRDGRWQMLHRQETTIEQPSGATQ